MGRLLHSFSVCGRVVLSGNTTVPSITVCVQRGVQWVRVRVRVRFTGGQGKRVLFSWTKSTSART